MILKKSEKEISVKKSNGRSGLYLKVSSPNAKSWLNAQKYMAVFDGTTPVYVYFEHTKKLTLAPKSMWVSVCDALLRALKEELGEKNVVMVD